MSRQIQIRRGTAAEHTTFTGAIGEITMDTTNNTLRVHDGTTAGGTPLAKQSEIPEQYVMPDNYDFVIECQTPSADNNYTWYRKYKSGWVEQGGYSAYAGGWGTKTINLPVTMRDVYYTLTIGGDGTAADFTNSATATVRGCSRSSVTARTTTSFQCQSNNIVTWQVKGVAAQ